MMKLRYLAIALATACAPPVAAYTWSAENSAAAPFSMEQGDLPALLAAPYNGIVPLTKPWAGTDVAWVRRSDLSEAAVRNRVVDAMNAGATIVVLGPARDDDGDVEAETFGFAGSGRVSAYRRTADGALDVKTIDDGLHVEEATAALDEWMTLRSQAQPSAPPPALARAMVAVNSLPAGEGSSDVPRVEIHQDKSFKGGRSVRHHIVVLRDIEASRDQKVVLVNTEVDMVPSVNGAVWNGKFQPDGAGYALFIPDRYVVTTQLAGVGEPVPLTIDQYEPKSDGATERTINETLAVKTSYGASASFDILEGLEKNGTPHLGKMTLGFNYGKERTEQSSVTMNLKDYFVESSTRSGSGPGATRAVDWSFTLARDIARSVDYFNDGDGLAGPLNSTRRMTPMMRRATLQTASVWRLPGTYEGRLDVITRASVDVRIYDSLEATSDAGPDRDADTTFVTRLNLDSAYLTRQPTVRLQSLHGTGECLAQPDPGTRDVLLQPCGKGPGGKSQQWFLEADMTYRNRGSGQCLTADPNSGDVYAAACTRTTLNQQWRWSADRIQSLFEGGNRWRLHVRDGKLNARFDPQRHQELISNQYHALLRPWSSYPNKPSEGDVIPNLAGLSPAVPKSYLLYNAVSVDERWQPLPVRSGL